METEPLTTEEKKQLLELARQAITQAVRGRKIAPVNIENYSPKLQQPGASFVTLTKHGMLRGCIGALEPYQPLVQDVCEHAVAAALNDYRFPELTSHEIDEVEIEISRLTLPKPVEYQDPEELIHKLRPFQDGVILRDGNRRATFLPQVWEKIPDVEDFLDQLCLKMGAPANLWRKKKLMVEVYQVEEFSESKMGLR